LTDGWVNSAADPRVSSPAEGVGQFRCRPGSVGVPDNTKLAQTSETQVAVIMLVMNLEKIRKNLYCVFILAMIVGRKTPKSHFPGGLGYSKMAA
jgi:hypothetical protein